ncbi:MAG: FAD-dependent oxidoreductase [Lachnospiraceae bacterium]|nr:FAD-dependent oxidoreductase [Lachnospiraceae bacterium]
MGKTIIVGGVAAGASCAARLRRLKENEEIILLERGEYISYANCGLPYHVGKVIGNREDLLVMKKPMMENRFHIDVRNNSEVTSINRDKQRVSIREVNGKEYEESYDNLVIATGSSPLKPRIEGMESQRVKTLWTVPDTDEIKSFIQEQNAKKAVVVGGGFIGLEMAENLQFLGMDVTIVEAANQIMAPLDYELALLLNENIRKNGVKLILNNGVSRFEDKTDGIDVVLSDEKVVSADLVILAIGVRPNSELARDAGLELNERGGIVVNENMQTSDPYIYAAGDVVEVEDFVLGEKTMVPLAGPANKQGRIVADNIAGIPSKYAGTQGSSVVKVFDLNAAATGVNEKTLIKKGWVKNKDYRSLLITQNSHAGYYPGATPIYVKLLFSMDGNEIYGGAVVGRDGVDKRIDTLGVALRLHASVFDLTNLELSYAPPFSSAKDPVNMAGYVAENMINGFVEIAEWNELDVNENAVILDVREKPELTMFAFQKGVNIPLSELRNRYEELDKQKEYVIFCAIGVRAYNAYKILKEKGFTNIKIYPAGTRFYMSTHVKEEEVSKEFICKF